MVTANRAKVTPACFIAFLHDVEIFGTDTAKYESRFLDRKSRATRSPQAIWSRVLCLHPTVTSPTGHSFATGDVMGPCYLPECH